MKKTNANVTEREPFNVKEIRAFADAVEVGSTITARLPFETWTSTSNYSVHYKTVSVVILRKYPFLVKTDKGLFSWVDLAYGYHNVDESPAENSLEIDEEEAFDKAA